MSATGDTDSADGTQRQQRNPEGKPGRSTKRGNRASEHDQRAAERGGDAGGVPLLRGKRPGERRPVNPEQSNRNMRDTDHSSADTQPGRALQKHERKASARGGQSTIKGEHRAPRGHAEQPQRNSPWAARPENTAGRAGSAKEFPARARLPEQRLQSPRRAERQRDEENWSARNDSAGQYHSRGPANRDANRTRSGGTSDWQRPNRRGPGDNATNQPRRPEGPRRGATNQSGPPGERRGVDRPGFGRTQIPRPNGARSGQAGGKPIGFGAKNGVRHPGGSDAGLGFGRQDPARTGGSNSLPTGFGRGNATSNPGGPRGPQRGRPSRPDEKRPERGQERGGRASGRQRRGPPEFGPRRQGQ